MDDTVEDTVKYTVDDTVEEIVEDRVKNTVKDTYTVEDRLTSARLPLLWRKFSGSKSR